MQIKHKSIIYTALALIISVLLTACTGAATGGTKETESNGMAALTGVYSKTAVPLDENITGQAMTVYGETVYLCGIVRDGDNYTQTVAAVNTADLSVTYEPIAAEASFNNISVSDFGYLLLAVAFDQNTFEQTYTLYCIKDGMAAWEKPVSDIITLPDRYWGNICIGSDDYRWYVGGDKTLAILSFDGTVEKTETLPDMIEGIYRDTDGTAHIAGSGFHYIADENGKIANNNAWQQALSGIASNSVYFGPGHDFYYGNENALYGYDIESPAPTEIMNWVNSGLVPSGQMQLAVISPDSIFYYGSDGIGGMAGLWHYTRADTGMSAKTVIRVTYMEDGRNRIPMAAVKFNESQNVYHVVCEEYASLSGAGDYAALLDGLDAAILDGSVGDIVELSGRDALVKYSEKNLLTDLYTLMSDDIFGCIREAYEINGRLYGIPQEFRLTTYAAKTQNLNIANIWNTGAFIEHAASLPEGQRMLFNMSRAAVYNMLRDSAISESIDFETNSCSFTAGAFAEFMEYLAGLPETDSEEAEYGMNYYIDDRVALYEAYIGAYSDYARMKHVFGENTEVTSVGYPSSTGGAAKMNAGKLYAITESGTEKEGAVSFLRYLLSPESVINENRGMHDIPAVKTTLKAWNESESKMYYYFYTDNINSMSGDIKPITEEDAGSPGVCVAVDQALTDEVYAYLDSVQIIPAIPQIVADIVDEEMSAYLSSDNKTAEETAKIIQNRVSIYLSEQEESVIKQKNRGNF